VVILEAGADRDALLACLDHLAEVCDAGTKMLVIGHVNDVLLYRELTRRGVSDYLIAPIGTLDLIQSISDMFHAPGAVPIGRTIAVVGAKGGVGASTVAHNLAWAIARKLATATVIVDLDIAFGTAGLDFNQDPTQGIADAVFAPGPARRQPGRPAALRCGDNLSLLAASAMLDRRWISPRPRSTSFSTSCELDARASSSTCPIPGRRGRGAPSSAPTTWSWSRPPSSPPSQHQEPARRPARRPAPNDRKPSVVLNSPACPKRPEIPAAEFAKALGMDLAAVIPVRRAAFGTAANNGQMVAEVQPGRQGERPVRRARRLDHGPPGAARRAGLFGPIISKVHPSQGILTYGGREAACSGSDQQRALRRALMRPACIGVVAPERRTSPRARPSAPWKSRVDVKPSGASPTSITRRRA
jgi:pilus assembly protein CpaE